MHECSENSYFEVHSNSPNLGTLGPKDVRMRELPGTRNTVSHTVLYLEIATIQCVVMPSEGESCIMLR